MEVRPEQIVDLLLRGGRDRPAPIQHNSYSQERILLPQVDLHEVVRPHKQDQEGTPKNGEIVKNSTIFVK